MLPVSRRTLRVALLPPGPADGPGLGQQEVGREVPGVEEVEAAQDEGPGQQLRHVARRPARACPARPGLGLGLQRPAVEAGGGQEPAVGQAHGQHGEGEGQDVGVQVAEEEGEGGELVDGVVQVPLAVLDHQDAGGVPADPLPEVPGPHPGAVHQAQGRPQVAGDQEQEDRQQPGGDVGPGGAQGPGGAPGGPAGAAAPAVPAAGSPEGAGVARRLRATVPSATRSRARP